MHKVEGHEGLIKDPRSNAVINVDNSAYRRARAAKKRILDEQQKNQELESRVSKLEDILEQLLKDKENG